MNCKNTIRVKSSSVEDNNRKLIITVNALNFATFSNLQYLDLIICQNIPCSAETKKVYLSDGTNQVEVLVRTGNTLRADQIKSRRCYPMIFGNDSEHFSLLNFVPESSYEASSSLSLVNSDISEEPVVETTSAKAKTSK